MPAGFQAFNGNSEYLIDGSNVNLTFLLKGSANGTVDFYSPSYPIVFVRCTQGCLFWVEYLGNNMYRYHCDGDFNYWVFCGARHINNVGLQIFNEAGQTVYTSDVDPLVLKGYVPYTREDYPPEDMSGSGLYWPTPYVRSNFGLAGGYPISFTRGYDWRHAYCPNLPGTRKVSARQPGETSLVVWSSMEALRVVSDGYDIVDVPYPKDPGIWAGWNDSNSHFIAKAGKDWSAGPGGVLIADVSMF